MRGWRRTLRAGMQAYVFARRSWYITYRRIPAESALRTRPGLDCRLATAADVERLAAAFAPIRKRREFHDWIAEGSLVFVAYQDDKPISFHRVSHAVPAGAPLSSLTLAPGQVWSADMQTLPPFRGQHVGTALRSFRDRTLYARGAREYVGSVQSDNLPAMIFSWGGSRRLVERVERLDYLCLLGIRRIRRVPDALAAFERALAEAHLLPEDPASRSLP